MTRLLQFLWLLLPCLLLAQAPRTVIVFGDSITQGGSLPKEHKDQLWVTRVEKQAAGALILINEGKGGRPTNSVDEFEDMLKRHPKADALVIALGMNDSRDVTPNCVPKAVANVRMMIEKARAAYGGKLPVLLVGPTNINQSALGPTKPIGDQREANLRALGDAFAKLAADAHGDFVSLLDVVPDASLLKDGVHPDAQGNKAIANVMSAKLRTWMADSSP
ncbi:MAG: SGNH/GDSL hydrolase family protein [Verrucomicrobiota bacterium]